MVITPSFQVGDVGSIPTIRSINILKVRPSTKYDIIINGFMRELPMISDRTSGKIA